MTNAFFDAPVLNSPYDYRRRHWDLDEARQPTNRILDQRRPASHITPVPRPRKQRGQAKQAEFVLDEGQGPSTEEQQYDPTSTIRFPRVQGYRVELPNERLDADFNDDSTLALTPELIEPSVTDVWAMQDELAAEIDAHFDRLNEDAAGAAPAVAG